MIHIMGMNGIYSNGMFWGYNLGIEPLPCTVSRVIGRCYTWDDTVMHWLALDHCKCTLLSLVGPSTS